MCEVQKWHTFSRRISLRRANCLAKINHMLAAGLRMLEATHMYRSSLTLAFVVLYLGGRRGQRPVIRLRGARRNSTRLPLMSTCVRDRPIGNGLTRTPVMDIGSPLTGRWIPHTARRHRSMASTNGPTPRSRSMSNARPLIRSVTTLPSATTRASATTRRNRTTAWNTRRGRRCPCPTVRAHAATTAMAGGPPATETRSPWDG